MEEELVESTAEESIEESTAEVQYLIQVPQDQPLLVVDPYVRYMLFGIVIVLAALAVHNIFKKIRGTD